MWESHVRWWESRRDRKDWIIVVEDTLGGRPVGSIYATDLDQEAPEIGLYIGEVSAWGKGIASQALHLAVRQLYKMKYRRIRAYIKEGHTSSQRLFTRLGFCLVGQEADGAWYKLST